MSPPILAPFLRLSYLSFPEPLRLMTSIGMLILSCKCVGRRNEGST